MGRSGSQSRQSDQLLLQSSELGPPPPPVLGGVAHSLAREGLGESQFRRGYIQYTVVLFLYTYFVIYSVLGFLSSRSNWLPPMAPPPHPHASVAPPPFGSKCGTHSLAVERTGGANSNEWTATMVLLV